MKTKIIFIITYPKKIYCFIFIILFILIALFSLLFIRNNNDNIFVDLSNLICNSNENNLKPKVAIIIDDFGEDRNGVKEMMQIKRPLTFAVMPFMEYSVQDATLAHKNGYEVIVHLPMETYGNKLSWVGPRPIKTSLSDEQIKKIVLDSLDSVPYAVGANVHMGSKASQNERVMTSVMEVLKDKGLYFVDSRSCKKPIGKSVAEKVGINFAERNVFLEHLSKNKDKIKIQLNKVENYALKRGIGIAIGHVGTEGGKVTAKAIEEMIPELENKGIELVFISELFNIYIN